jgi:YceI-like domain
MKRGQLVGAIVLIGAIGIIIAERLGQDTTEPRAGEVLVAQVAEPDTSVAGGVALPAAGEVRTYTIDAAQSEVYWRIYRAGTMARLGHNHVISITALDGSVRLGSDPAQAEWSLSFPVGELVVDDPELRARYGEDFESVPSDRDKAGTRENMLTDRVLNGALFPAISLHGTGVEGPLDDANLPVSIEILGRTIEQSFPASISVDGDSLTVTGEYRLTHEDLGLEPFTALGGLMAVGENIDFTYRIRAIADGQ